MMAMIGKVHVWVVALSLLPAGVQSTTVNVRRADIPIPMLSGPIGAAEGEVKLQLAVAQDGTVKPIARPPSLAVVLAEKLLEGWRFNGSGELEFSFSNKIIDGGDPCRPPLRRVQTLIVARLPSALAIESLGADRPCNGGPPDRVVLAEPFGSVLVGRVTCDCPGLAGGANAQVLVSSLTGGIVRTLSTDREGIFRADSLPSGRYYVEVSKTDFGVGAFELTIVTGIPERTGEFRIEPARWANQPPVPRVTSVRLPVYPESLRVAGVEGTATVRVSLAGNVVTDTSVTAVPSDLAASAVETVRAWRFAGEGKTVSTIQFEYKLLPRDCSGDQRQQVIIQLVTIGATKAEIAARRGLPCRQ